MGCERERHLSRIRGLALVTMAVMGLTACETVSPGVDFVPSASYRKIGCEDVPGLPGYCAVGVVPMNHIGYSLILLSPRAPVWTTSIEYARLPAESMIDR